MASSTSPPDLTSGFVLQTLKARPHTLTSQAHPTRLRSTQVTSALAGLFGQVAVSAEQWARCEEVCASGVAAYLEAKRAQGYTVIALEQVQLCPEIKCEQVLLDSRSRLRNIHWKHVLVYSEIKRKQVFG
eukprot:3419010-Rhodomonas_salina.2